MFCGGVQRDPSRLEGREAVVCTKRRTANGAGAQEVAAGAKASRDWRNKKGLSETEGGSVPEKEEGDEGSVRQALSSSKSGDLVSERAA